MTCPPGMSKFPAVVRLAVLTLAGALLLTGPLIGTAPPADAHTTLKKASPAAGSIVPSPGRIELTFGDPVMLPQVVVLDAAGGRHEAGRPQAVDNTVTQQVAGPLAPGPYRVGWRVVAADGHPVSGEYRFTVAVSPGQAAGQATPGSGGSAPAGSGATTTARPGTAAPAAGSSDAGWWWVALGIALAAVAGAVIALTRRRSNRTASS